MKIAVDGFHGVGIDQGEIARKSPELYEELEKGGAFDNHAEKIVEGVDLFKKFSRR